METKTIIVKDIRTKEGYTKANKPWTRTTLVSENGGYYSTFRSLSSKPIKPGCEVILDAEQAAGQKLGSFDISRIVSVSAPPKASGPAGIKVATGKAGLPGTEQGKGSPNPTHPQSEGEPSLSSEASLRKKLQQETPDLSGIVARRLSIAQGIVDARFPEAREMHDYLTMVTEVLHQLQNEEWLQIELKKSR